MSVDLFSFFFIVSFVQFRWALGFEIYIHMLHFSDSRDFPVEVGVHSVLSPLLFIIVMEALSKRFDDRIALGVVICR